MYEKPDLIHLKEPQKRWYLHQKKKKNLRRQTESKTGEFKFIICGNNILVYPVLLKIEDVIIANYSLNLKITSLQQTRTGKNIATHFTPHTNIIKIKIKNINCKVPWLPGPDDFCLFNFKNP